MTPPMTEPQYPATEDDILAIEREAAAAERERVWEAVKPVLDMLPNGYGRDPRFAAMWDAFHPDATDD